MICTSLCIGSPLAINRAQILSPEGFRLVFPVLAFHAVALTLGYWVSKIPALRYISQFYPEMLISFLNSISHVWWRRKSLRTCHNFHNKKTILKVLLHHLNRNEMWEKPLKAYLVTPPLNKRWKFSQRWKCCQVLDNLLSFLFLKLDSYSLCWPQARGRSVQNNFIMHRNAKLDPGRAAGHTVPREQSGSSSGLFGGCHGYYGPLSSLFLGQWL